MNTGKKPAILLVDDHPANLVALQAVLGTSDYELIEASSGEEALRIAEKRELALVLLDIQMPGMDGYEVAKRLKASPRTSGIPIIFITAIYKEDPHVQKGYEVGGVDFFTKPFNPDVLRFKVAIYADLYSKARERVTTQSRQAAELTTVLESIPDAIYIGDEKGVTKCNPAALGMFGLEPDASRGLHYETLAEHVRMRYPGTLEPIPPTEQPFAHALRGERRTMQIVVRHGASGVDLPLTCAVAPVLLDGKIIGAAVVNSLESRSVERPS